MQRNKTVKHRMLEFPRFYSTLRLSRRLKSFTRFPRNASTSIVFISEMKIDFSSSSDRTTKRRKFSKKNSYRRKSVATRRVHSLAQKLVICRVIVTWSDSGRSSRNYRDGKATLYVLYKNNEQREILMMLLQCG